MSVEGAVAVMIGAAIALLAIGVFAWRRRTTRAIGPLAPVDELPADAVVAALFDGFYVATTRHEAPLERVTGDGLGFRDRARLTVTDKGVALDLSRSRSIVWAPDRLLGVDQSTVAIDRVVERDGLTRLTWRTVAGQLVDTYFRPQDASAKTVADAIRPLLAPTPNETIA